MRKSIKIIIFIGATILILSLLCLSGILSSLNDPFNHIVSGEPNKSCISDDDCVLKQKTCHICDCGNNSVNKNWERFCPFPTIRNVFCKNCSSQNFEAKCVENQCFAISSHREDLCINQPGKTIYPEKESCCEGLSPIFGSQLEDGSCWCTEKNNSCAGLPVCAPCGNGACESQFGEDKCNCPKDCNDTKKTDWPTQLCDNSYSEGCPVLAIFTCKNDQDETLYGVNYAYLDVPTSYYDSTLKLLAVCGGMPHPDDDGWKSPECKSIKDFDCDNHSYYTCKNNLP